MSATDLRVQREIALQRTGPRLADETEADYEARVNDNLPRPHRVAPTPEPAAQDRERRETRRY